MLTVNQYFMGRDKQYPVSDEVRANAAETVRRANELIGILILNGLDIHVDPVSSGWRPLAINAKTKDAAPNSKHITGQAIDIRDPGGHIDTWLAQHTEALEQVGLWLESPAHTANWSHWQSVPPRSGRRVFLP